MCWTLGDCEGYVRVAAPIRGCVGHKVIVKGMLGLRRQLEGVLDTR